MSACSKVLISLVFLSVSCCTSKSITKPRSQIIEEARSAGVTVSSLEEERRNFLDAENLQKEKIYKVIQARAVSGDAEKNYRIGPADEIEINVFDVPELNLSLRVKESGFVSLPLVGGVKAAGLTESELQELIVKSLSNYVKSPQVGVFVSKYGSQKVSILGAVKQPGSYALKKGSNSIIEILSLAGGVTPRAGNYINFIPAEYYLGNGVNELEARARLALQSDKPIAEPALNATGIQVYLDQIYGSNGGVPIEIPIRAGDVVVIPDAGRIIVDGEVQKVGTFEFMPNMTLLAALGAAGGITYSAKVDEVELLRETIDGRQVRLIVDLTKLLSGEDRDTRLKSGDIIRVPSDESRRLRHDTFEGITKLINFGVGGNVNLAN